MFQNSKTKPKKKRDLGIAGEQFVATYLQNEGYTILASNYKKFYGEIDLIAKKGQLIVFVEVKTRKNQSFPLSEVIVQQKRNHIIKTAYAFIAEHSYDQTNFRFDVALVEKKENEWKLTYIPQAFSPSGW